jgi:uncharacterized lipoprotein YajG
MKRITFLLILIISAMACRKPYNPPAITSPAGYLVVEGVINSSSDSTTIKLSRTVNISSATPANAVLHALVSIESDQNVSFPLTETTNGNYVSAGLNLDKSHTYRLSIKTSKNEQYYSDFVPVNITPPIDSVGFKILSTPADTGIQIYANTHDPSNTVKYYRWDYDENWEFSAKYISYWKADGPLIRIRQANENITVCYTSDVSSDIVLGSSAKLQQDVIYQNPIVNIPSTSEKIENEYTILLREYALTADAYNFWVSLKKNTEQLGSIFDAQPSQISGNIHCITNPSEPVIGYVSVSTVSSKRIYISNAQLPNWVPTYPYNCQQDSVFKRAEIISTLILDSVNFIPTGPIPAPGATTSSFFYYSSRECVNCTIRGTTTPPAFWK